MKSASFAICLLICVLGCTKNGAISSPFGWGIKDDPADLAKYGPSPTQRRDDIRRMSRYTHEMSDSERQLNANKLTQQLKDEQDPLLRIEILKALAALQTPAAQEGLRMGLYDNEPRVRVMAVETLVVGKDPKAVEELGDLIVRDRELDVRLAAAKALEQFDSPESRKALAPAIQDRDPALRYVAIQSLKEHSQVDYGGDTAKWEAYAMGEKPSPPENVSMTSWLIPSFMR
ncbi:HEAT repeat domain-containing protein [Blastopirellula sp. JC732]|uniref:HEAT repeat domain-containing protein n=1 Tax=Blastopirellula sediminis TaxID=2894196 RepID=A0A9X1MRB4_9BACT|nr:HEAT repeat domain-containing protein [Blastopirellula sediminis]MCC9604758.1 HEAT repeat domain-containing protein [Blastopirellula sediminis]MCC9631943.1 HEAT repeat domain-containing protein [Blastopirellula sediminis]